MHREAVAVEATAKAITVVVDQPQHLVGIAGREDAASELGLSGQITGRGLGCPGSLAGPGLWGR